MIIKELGGGKLIIRSIMDQLWINERSMLDDVSFEVFGGFSLSWNVLFYHDLLSIFVSAPCVIRFIFNALQLIVYWPAISLGLALKVTVTFC